MSEQCSYIIAPRKVIPENMRRCAEPATNAGMCKKHFDIANGVTGLDHEILSRPFSMSKDERIQEQADRIKELEAEKQCQWQKQCLGMYGEYDSWNTSCGEDFAIEDEWHETPTKFCSNCGGKTVVIEQQKERVMSEKKEPFDDFDLHDRLDEWDADDQAKIEALLRRIKQLEIDKENLIQDSKDQSDRLTYKIKQLEAEIISNVGIIKKQNKRIATLRKKTKQLEVSLDRANKALRCAKRDVG